MTGASLPAQIPTLDLVYEGIDRPTHIVSNSYDSGVYISSLSGDIFYFSNFTDAPIVTQIPNVNDTIRNNGLFGMAFHPKYPDSNYIYVHYTYDTSYFDVRISRFDISNHQIDATSEHIILSNDNIALNHQGGNPIFIDSLMYFAKGDGHLGVASVPKVNGQDVSNMFGSVIRIDVDRDSFPSDPLKNYAIPPSNPFVNNSAYTPEIYAFGLRSPWRMTYDDVSNQLIVGDVGSNVHEEINIIEAGNNYGWACTEGTNSNITYPCFSPPTDPFFSFDRDEFGSLTGGYIYRGSDHPNLYGKYIFADFVYKKLCYLDDSFVKCWDETNSLIDYNIVSFGIDPNNEIYAADHITGNIYRLGSDNTDCDVDTLVVTNSSRQIHFANKLIDISNVSFQKALYLNSPEVIIDSLSCINNELLLNEYNCTTYSEGTIHFNQN